MIEHQKKLRYSNKKMSQTVGDAILRPNKVYWLHKLPTPLRASTQLVSAKFPKLRTPGETSGFTQGTCVMIYQIVSIWRCSIAKPVGGKNERYKENVLRMHSVAGVEMPWQRSIQ